MKTEIMNELVNDIKNLNHCYTIGDEFSVFLRILDRMDYFFNELRKITGVRHYVEYNEKLGEFEIK